MGAANPGRNADGQVAKNVGVLIVFFCCLLPRRQTIAIVLGTVFSYSYTIASSALCGSANINAEFVLCLCQYMGFLN